MVLLENEYFLTYNALFCYTMVMSYDLVHYNSTPNRVLHGPGLDLRAGSARKK